MSPEGHDQQGAESGYQVIPHDSPAAARAEAFEQAVGPFDGLGLDGIKKAEQRKAGQLTPEAHGHAQPQNDPHGDHFVPDDMAGVGHAHMPGGDGAGPPAYGNAGGNQPADLCRAQPQCQHQVGQPGPQAAHRAGGDAGQAGAKAQSNQMGRVLQHELHAGVGDSRRTHAGACFAIDSCLRNIGRRCSAV